MSTYRKSAGSEATESDETKCANFMEALQGLLNGNFNYIYTKTADVPDYIIHYVQNDQVSTYGVGSMLLLPHGEENFRYAELNGGALNVPGYVGVGRDQYGTRAIIVPVTHVNIKRITQTWYGSAMLEGNVGVWAKTYVNRLDE